MLGPPSWGSRENLAGPRRGPGCRGHAQPWDEAGSSWGSPGSPDSSCGPQGCPRSASPEPPSSRREPGSFWASAALQALWPTGAAAVALCPPLPHSYGTSAAFLRASDEPSPAPWGQGHHRDSCWPATEGVCPTEVQRHREPGSCFCPRAGCQPCQASGDLSLSLHVCKVGDAAGVRAVPASATFPRAPSPPDTTLSLLLCACAQFGGAPAPLHCLRHFVLSTMQDLEAGSSFSPN